MFEAKCTACGVYRLDGSAFRIVMFGSMGGSQICISGVQICPLKCKTRTQG